MQRLSEYLHQRKIKIKADIDQDNKIKADNYHNVGLLKEIEKVMKVVKVIRISEKYSERW